MKVKCCWNEAHDSTITEDRANPVSAWRRGGDAQSLAGRGIERILVVWKRGLKARGNVPFGESSAMLEARSGGLDSVNPVARADKKIRARGADFGHAA